MTTPPSPDPFAVPSSTSPATPARTQDAQAAPPTGPWVPATRPQPAAGRPPRRRGMPGYDESQPYHRILRTRNYRWWRPLLGLVVAGGSFLVMSLAVTTAALVPALLSGAIDLDDAESDSAAALISDPLGLLGVNLSLAVLIPAAILGLLAGHQLRPGWLNSVAGRMRWKFLLGCLLLEVGVTIVVLPISALVGGDVASSADATEPLSFAAWVPFALVILLTTPLQAAGEEYGFRGYGLQALGAWVRHPWFAVVVTSLLFALAHGSQNPALFLNRFAFGVIAALLTIRTGGLEAAIGIHVVNNLGFLLIASAAGELAPTLTPTAAPWSITVLDVIGMLAYAGLALWLARRMNLQVETQPSPPLPPVPPPGQPPAPYAGPWAAPPSGGFGQPPVRG
jgi:membrane protease YdiL (CAAX protease family)